MPASCRSGRRHSSASAPMPRASSPSTASSTSRCVALDRSPGLPLPPSASSRASSVLRGSDLTRLMVTLGSRARAARALANRFSDITGGSDGLQGIIIGPVLGLFEFDIFGKVAYIYCLAVLFVMFLIARRIVQFAVRSVAAGDPQQSAARRSAVGIAVNRRLVAVFTIACVLCRRRGWRSPRRPRPSPRSMCSPSTAPPICCWC